MSEAQKIDSPTWAGAAMVEITPQKSVFLFGYPHVPRWSEGVHDPLECAALYVCSSNGRALFLANDLIYFSRDYAATVRARVARETGVPLSAIMLTATHTHSGPVMTNNLSNSLDAAVSQADQEYLSWLAGQIVRAACEAVNAAEPVELGLAEATVEGVGTNRHDPAGPTDPQVPVLVARSRASGQPVACLFIYGMHPTVLHEDSKLISADFPAFTRQWLRERILPARCPILFLQGASGDQSPRHTARANTYGEAQRLGELLGERLAQAISQVRYQSVVGVCSRTAKLHLQPRKFPTVAVAQGNVLRARQEYERLRLAKAPAQEIRTAQVNVFGAEKTAVLAQAAADGRLEKAVHAASPAEIQVIEIGPWRFAAWPGEFFVDYALALKEAAPAHTYVVTVANGELQGYIATASAVERQTYEATNAVFEAGNGRRFVEATLALLSVAD